MGKAARDRQAAAAGASKAQGDQDRKLSLKMLQKPDKDAEAGGADQPWKVRASHGVGARDHDRPAPGQPKAGVDGEHAPAFGFAV